MMNWIAENALPIWVGGFIALTMALVVYSQTRTNQALLGVAAVVVVTASLLTAEWLLETPREAVVRTLYELAAAVEANDVSDALAFLAPTANSQLRHDIENLMPLVNVERARILDSPQVEFAPGDEPVTATVVFRGFIYATVKQSGAKGGQEERVTMTFARHGKHWLVEDYTTAKRNWRRALRN